MCAATLSPADAAPLTAPASPAGPLDEGLHLPEPPMIPLSARAQMLRFNQRQIEFVFRARRELGEVFQMRGTLPGNVAVTSHPDHVKSLFTADPKIAPSVTGESPLRPIVGSTSVLTAVGPRHLRQRKLLLPPFHGEAIAQYVAMIEDVTARELDSWPVGKPIALAPRMQTITLDVIMAGIFGIEGRPKRGSEEWWLREATRAILNASTHPLAQVTELRNANRTEATGLLKRAIDLVDKPTYAIIRKRRAAADVDHRRDVLSLLIGARTEEGEALTDEELRNELLTLVLAGHETTANQMAWAWERLVRTPDAHARLVDTVRAGGGAGDDDASKHAIETTITEAMRSRPVIPIIGRRVQVPWRLGEYAMPAGSVVSMSILLVHHREDLYPDPFAFRPERWDDRKPGTYEWIPFGGGIRRCLGAALAMAEQRVVVREMARRLDLEAATPEPEHAVHRNVTMIPSKGGRVVVRARRA